jgi:hypothetical protein
MAYDQRALVGVGGWLAFFVITLGLFSPLRAAFQIAGTISSAEQFSATFGPLGQPLMIFEILLMGVAVIGLIFLAWRLMVSTTWSTVRLTVAGLWLLGPVLGLVDVLVVLAAGIEPTGLINAMAVPMVQTVVYAGIWTAYLLRSDRVANTYLRNNDEAELAAVFD